MSFFELSIFLTSVQTLVCFSRFFNFLPSITDNTKHLAFLILSYKCQTLGNFLGPVDTCLFFWILMYTPKCLTLGDFFWSRFDTCLFSRHCFQFAFTSVGHSSPFSHFSFFLDFNFFDQVVNTWWFLFFFPGFFWVSIKILCLKILVCFSRI